MKYHSHGLILTSAWLEPGTLWSEEGKANHKDKANPWHGPFFSKRGYKYGIEIWYFNLQLNALTSEDLFRRYIWR